MNKSQLCLVCLILCSLFASLSASICWRRPICTCTGREKATIYCRYVRDISDILELIRNQTLHVYRIRLHGTYTTIPSKAFENVSVSVLVFAAPLVTDIPEDSLLGIQNLDAVILNTTEYQIIPEVFSNQNYAQFESTHGRLTTITTQLQNMSLATSIRLNKNLISSISQDAFYGSENVRVLDLSHNVLTSLHPRTLSPMTNLQEVYLQHNQLISLDRCFTRLDPKILNLYGNNLTDVEKILHHRMRNLQYLNVGGNSYVQIHMNYFDRGMESLNELHLSNNSYTKIDSQLLKNLRKLLYLYLNNNDLTFLPGYFFENNPFINVLQLSNNRLKSVEKVMVGRREWYNSLTLALDGNELQKVTFGRKPLLISHLDLSRNWIRRIQAEDMVALQGVVSLNISANGLSYIESESFKDFDELMYLDLSHNNLKQLNQSLRGLPNLSRLVLRSSSLEYLSGDDFVGTERIKGMELQNNNLLTVHGAFQYMKYISYVNLAYNNLTTLSADSFPPSPRQAVRVRKLWMTSNPWACDCRLAWMVTWLKKGGSSLLDEPICSSPDYLYDQSLRSLNLTDYEQWKEECPDICECVCRAEGDLMYTEVRCLQRELSEVPQILPSNVKILDLRKNAFVRFDSNDFLRLHFLETLNLEHNQIEEVLLPVALKLSSLRLAYNRIRSLGANELSAINESFKEISLKGNPWKCDCNTWYFRNWLIENNHTVLDASEVRCGNEESVFLRDKPIMYLTRQDLCSLWPNIVIASICSTLFLILTVLCACYRHSLAALLYSWGCTCLKRGETTESPYDAFLMYSEEDEQLALRELAPGLENERHQFTLCIPPRDIPSPRTPQKINAYLLQCTKVIVLLTGNFVENRDYMRLLVSAMSFSTENSARYIIFVTQGELPPAEDQDPLLKTLMRSCVCLNWGQRLFWQKLIYQLPKTGLKVEHYSTDEESPLNP